MKNRIILFIFATGCALSAWAVPITYILSGTGTGSVGATPFADAAFTIRVFADTGSIAQSSPLFQVEAISSTVDVTGFPSAVFTVDERVLVAQDVPALAFSRSLSRGGNDLLDIENAAFANYDLRSTFGPVFDPAPFAVSQFWGEPSTLGNVAFTSARDVTFTATVVPEPSSLALVGIGLFATLRRRGRQWGEEVNPTR